jgi:large subunit ribosomal protein L23
MIKQERLLKIILSPHMSEKAAIAKEAGNQYVFQVARDATKQLIKEAVESLFNTSVVAVRIVNVKSKPKRFGSIQGKSKAWKKAYVKLAADQKIEFVSA